MAMKIRLARGGAKKRPYYRIVAADGRMPRDGRFIEKLGTYNPLLPKDDEKRVVIDSERIKYWLSEGAQPTDRVSRFLEAKGLFTPKMRNNPKKGVLGKKATDRLAQKEAKIKETQEAEQASKETANQEEQTQEADAKT